MPEKYETVLELMKSKGGRIEVSDPDLSNVLGTSRSTGKDLTYRLSVYMSYIRRFAHLQVVAERTGKKAIAYSLVRANSANEDVAIWQQSKYILTPDSGTT